MKAFLARLAFALGLLGGLFALTATSASAQGETRVRVGTITAGQSCTTWRNYEGSRLTYSEAEYARWWGAAAARRYYLSHTTWRSWVVKDCQDNFTSLRDTVEASLASTGRLTVGRGGYTLDIRISNISSTPPATRQPVRGDASYRTSWGTALVTADYILRDRNGDSVDGGAITKRIEMSRTIDTNRMSVSVSEPGAAVYNLMQNEVALAIAREVTFTIEPARVIAAEGDRIEINYGRPLVELGDRLDVKKTRGIGSIRYRVVSASDNDAVAEVDGDNDTSDIEPGNLVTFIEKDSDAANARRFQRRRLP
ncbi:hypothetical protein NAP1_06470 [Erythrobacter sp. NAP1]|uniref:hypothetical protein n=1 Tax=Erythrobacter sp. NAP1 TaxID=237727 RepID=UPI0000686ECF|nr:hypothetical protein [Erythrobacter sp. NAP1]EAQ30400.1 hypothetical protein NAP1_06470 [Erythrobacter sp. NAP1]